jgi:hypothetical protein
MLVVQLRDGSAEDSILLRHLFPLNEVTAPPLVAAFATTADGAV